MSTRASIAFPRTKPMFYAEWHGTKVRTVSKVTPTGNLWKPRELSREQSNQGRLEEKYKSMVGHRGAPALGRGKPKSQGCEMLFASRIQGTGVIAVLLAWFLDMLEMLVFSRKWESLCLAFRRCEHSGQDIRLKSG